MDYKVIGVSIIFLISIVLTFCQNYSAAKLKGWTPKIAILLIILAIILFYYINYF